MSNKAKVLVILGPTASGKSSLAIKLAKKFNGEIISADSRQVYRGMDIGTGKVEPDRPGEIPTKFMNNKFASGARPFISDGIPHYMIDVVSPKTDYNAAKFQKSTKKIIEEILERKKLPIICGGTGFWISAIVDNKNFPNVKPDWKLRSLLRNYSADKLFTMLKRLDKERAKNIDPKNPVRLIRAIEIAKKLGSVPKLEKNGYELRATSYEFLQIGINIPKEKLHERIKIRLDQRFKQGMTKEVRDLHFKNKVSWKRLESFGLEYKFIAQYLQKKINKNEMEEKLFLAIKDFAKRQMTWWKKDSKIIWLKNYSSAEKETGKFLL
jgi:tRNA dimethylallyltransferase